MQRQHRYFLGGGGLTVPVVSYAPRPMMLVGFSVLLVIIWGGKLADEVLLKSLSALISLCQIRWYRGSGLLW